MILVRTGGLFGLVIAALVAALFLFVVRPAINDTTDRAFESANRALDDATRQLDETASFGAIVAQIKHELGPDAELLDLTVSEQGGGNVKYRTGNSAAGLQWGPGHEGLEPVKVTLIGSGKVADNVFPIAKLDPTATTKLTAAVRAKAGATFQPETMTLGLNPATRAVQWTVTGRHNNRTLVFTAKSDATGLERAG